MPKLEEMQFPTRVEPTPTIGGPRPAEPEVPVYRHFLAGGESRLRLPAGSAAGIAGCWLVALSPVLAISGGTPSSAGYACLVVAGIFPSVLLAVLVSRWAGRSSGTAAGLCSVGGWCLAATVLEPAELTGAASAAGAILVFALAEFSGRLPSLSRTWAVVAFYLLLVVGFVLSGTAVAVVVAAVCPATVLANGNMRDIRFFTERAGLATLGVGVAIWGVAVAVEGLPSAVAWLGPLGELPPGPLAMVWFAVSAGFVWFCHHGGHAACPLGRLVTGWILCPAVLALGGVIPVALAAAVSVPAWSAWLGPGLIHANRKRRAGRFRWVTLKRPSRREAT